MSKILATVVFIGVAMPFGAQAFTPSLAVHHKARAEAVSQPHLAEKAWFARHVAQILEGRMAAFPTRARP